MKHKLPETYETPGARDITIRDQGDRNTSAAISTAYAFDLMKKRQEDANI